MRSMKIVPILLLLLLQACDLSEAQRMDITRAEVRSVAPEVRGLKFLGKAEVPIASLLQRNPDLMESDFWQLDFGDRGTSSYASAEASENWLIRGWWKDSLIFLTPLVNSFNNWPISPAVGEWMRHPGELRTQIVLVRSHWVEDGLYDGHTQSDTSFPGAGISLPFRQDFNELHWDTAFAHRSVRTGDTLRLKVGVDRGSPGRSDSMPVFADYTGLRTVGDYVRYLKPDDTATLCWVVTAPTNDSLHLEVGWGSLGESRTFGFRVVR